MDHVSVLSVSMWCYYEDQYTIGLATHSMLTSLHNKHKT